MPAGREIAVARDLSFRLARTDSVLLLDADETISPRCVEALASALAHCDASLAYCGIATSGVRRGVLGWRLWGREVPEADGPFASIALVRRSAGELAGGGGRARGPGIARPDDAGFYARIAESGGWGVMVPEILAHRRLRCEIAEVDDDAIDGADADATLLVRAATILSAEGPRPLFRKAAKRLARGFFSLLPHRGEDAAPAGLGLPPGSSATPAGGDRDTPRRQPPQLRIRTPRGPWRFAVLSSSLGNCYFHQMRDLIASGIAELGHDVVRGGEQDGFRDDVDWNVVVAPHEFFFLGNGEALRLSDWPENVIIVSTEQPSTRWFAMAGECLERAQAVWDIDHNTSRLLRRRGIAADYLPLGYAPGFADYGHVAALPLHHGTCFLDDEVRRSPAAGRPLRDRPLDLFFVGGNTPRREAFFAGAAPDMAGHRAYIHLFDPTRPSLVGRTTYMDTATVVGLSQRSKVLLNVHHGTDVYFEWQRIVLHGLWQRTLVVSERRGLAPPFRAGIDYVEADLDEIPRVLGYYLDDQRGRREAQEIADAGHETLVSECRLSRFLEILLARHALTGAVLAHFGRGRSREAASSLLGA